MANTPTTYYAINKPASGDTGWGTTMNADMDTIDTALQGMAQLAGRSGGQTLYGDTAANGDIIIHGTAHSTRTTSYVLLQPTAGFVGVGTPTPLTKLNVVDTISTSPRGILSTQISTDTNGARVGFAKARGTPGAETTIVTGDTLGRLMFRGYDGTNYLEMASIEAVSDGTVASTRVPTYMAFSTATDAAPSVLTEVMRLTRSQRVGIGIGSATEKLDVLGQSISIGGDHGTWTARTTATDKSGYLVTPHYTAGEEAFIAIKLTSAAASNNLDIGGGASSYNSATAIVFSTAANNTTVTGTERMRITAAGNVGIGLTSPDSLLHVSNTTATNNAVAQVLTISNNVTDTGVGAAGFGSRILWEGESSTTADRTMAALDVIWTDATDATRTSYIKFSTVNSAGSLAERFRISGSGITSSLSTTYVNAVYEALIFNQHALTASPATASAVNYVANRFEITGSPGADSTGYFIGADNRAVSTGGYAKPWLIASQHTARNEASGTGTISQAVGVLGYVQNYATSGTITGAASLWGRVLNYDAGTITNAYGLLVQSAHNPSGTITTNYGVYVESQTAGGTDYAIVTNAGTSVFNEGGDAATDFRIEGDTSANLFFVDASVDKIKIGGTAERATTAGTNAIDIFDGTAPVGTLANGVSIYSKAGEFYALDAAGNETLNSPHDPETGEWIFWSRNTVTGRTYRVDMERMVAAIEALTGEKFTTETFS